MCPGPEDGPSALRCHQSTDPARQPDPVPYQEWNSQRRMAHRRAIGRDAVSSSPSFYSARSNGLKRVQAAGPVNRWRRRATWSYRKSRKVPGQRQANQASSRQPPPSVRKRANTAADRTSRRDPSQTTIVPMSPPAGSPAIRATSPWFVAKTMAPVTSRQASQAAVPLHKAQEPSMSTTRGVFRIGGA